MQGGKLKVGGHFKTSLFAYAVGISSNFGRIFRYLTNPETDQTLIRAYFKELAGHAFQYFWVNRMHGLYIVFSKKVDFIKIED